MSQAHKLQLPKVVNVNQWEISERRASEKANPTVVMRASWEMWTRERGEEKFHNHPTAMIISTQHELSVFFDGLLLIVDVLQFPMFSEQFRLTLTNGRTARDHISIGKIENKTEIWYSINFEFNWKKHKYFLLIENYWLFIGINYMRNWRDSEILRSLPSRPVKMFYNLKIVPFPKFSPCKIPTELSNCVSAKNQKNFYDFRLSSIRVVCSPQLSQLDFSLATRSFRP